MPATSPGMCWPMWAETVQALQIMLNLSLYRIPACLQPPGIDGSEAVCLDVGERESEVSLTLAVDCSSSALTIP